MGKHVTSKDTHFGEIDDNSMEHIIRNKDWKAQMVDNASKLAIKISILGTRYDGAVKVEVGDAGGY